MDFAFSDYFFIITWCDRCMLLTTLSVQLHVLYLMTFTVAENRNRRVNRILVDSQTTWNITQFFCMRQLSNFQKYS